MSPTTLANSAEVIKTLQRQHKITLRKVTQIERRVAEGVYLQEETLEHPIMSWFKDLLGMTTKGTRNGTDG